MTAGASPDGLLVSLDASSVPIRPAGAGRYVLELAGQLADRPDLRLIVVCRQGDEDRWRLGASVRVTGRAPRLRPLRLGWEQLWLPALLDREAPDVHHSPHYTMPERAGLPCVVTVHDVSFLEHPEWHERTKVPFFRRAIRVAAARADALVCVSATTAARLGALVPTRVPVHVIAHGVDHDRYFPLDPADFVTAESDRAALARLGVTSPYIGFVGTLEPRKDVPTLIRAFDRLAPGHPDLTLVLAGAPGWGIGAVEDALRTSAHGSRVQLVGYVSEDEKVALLRGAAVVAYASLDEGFGLPALEAMACGTPLVTTSGTAMEEVAGDAALLVPPGDDRALALALEASIAGGAVGAWRRALGLARAATHTWEASARAHLAVYRSVA